MQHDEPFLYAIDSFNFAIGFELEEDKDRWLSREWDVGLAALANNGREVNGSEVNGGSEIASSSRDAEVTDLGRRMANTTLNETEGQRQGEEEQQVVDRSE